MQLYFVYTLVILLTLLTQGCANHSLRDANIEEHGFAVKLQYVAQQESFSCGAASLEMVSHYWGKTIRQKDTVNSASGENKRVGFSVGDLKRIAVTNGYKAVSFAGNNQILEEQLTKGRPVIVALSLPYNRTVQSPVIRTMPPSVGAAYFMDNYSHFVVVVGMTKKKIIVMDPLTGIDTYSHKEFEKRWNDRSRAALLITS